MVYEWKGDTGYGPVHLVFSVAMYVNDSAIIDTVMFSVGRKARMCIQAENGCIRHHCRKQRKMYAVFDAHSLVISKLFFFHFIIPLHNV
jgi:hypothetical protein